MKLSRDTLPNYFTIADRHSSWHQQPTNTFDFVDRASSTLIVTVGDSWTWGSDISENNYNDNHRLKCLYGNILSQQVDTDWLNLGLSATSNFWLANMVEEFAKVVPLLDYEKIFVICVFTGTGRWFHTQYDRYIHYPGWVANNVFEPMDYNKLIYKFNQDCVERIFQSLKLFDHVVPLFATTFVDPLAFDQVPIDQHLTPWYKVMHCDDGLTSHVCMDGVKALLRMPEVITDQQHLSWFKQWMLDIIPVSEQRNQIFTDSTKFRNYHPLEHGHRQWAEYLASHLYRHFI